MSEKRKRKIKQEFVKLNGLDSCEADQVILKDDTTTEGEWTPTETFPYMKFPFTLFNPMQSNFLKYVDKDINVVLTAPTSSGKTAVIEMIISHSLSKGRKAIYLSPLKALSNEKQADWANIEHDFNGKKVALITGDYARTAAHMKAVCEADIIIMTSEALDSITRMATEEKYPFLYNADLISDESHLISESKRGDKLESAIMRFSKISPSARIILLSATMKKINDMAKWLTVLNGKETILYESKYRPCTLIKHYVRYKQNPGFTEKEAQEEILHKILTDNSDDSILTFVGSKKIGHMLESKMNSKNIPSKFYKADLDMKERAQLYSEFNDKTIRHLLSTTGLAWGINSMARHVVVAQTVFGGSEVISTNTLIQMIGRAGRKGKSDEGDAWILLKPSQFARDFDRIQNGEPLQSQMHDLDVIAFHCIAEIHAKEVKTPIDLVRWYDRSLARFQASRGMELYEAKTIFERLVRCGCIAEDPENMGSYVILPTGIIVAQMYLNPEDFMCQKMNFDKFFAKRGSFQSQDEEDYAFAKCLSDIPSYRNQRLYVSRDEMQIAKDYFNISISEGVDKIALCYYLILNNDKYIAAAKDNSKVFFFNLIINGLKADSERIISSLSQLDARTKRWGQKNYWQIIGTRLLYGCPMERLDLCQVESIGGARSKQLYDNGIRTVKDMVNNEFKVREILGDKVAETAMQSARVIHSANQIGW